MESQSSAPYRRASAPKKLTPCASYCDLVGVLHRARLFLRPGPPRSPMDGDDAIATPPLEASKVPQAPPIPRATTNKGTPTPSGVGRAWQLRCTVPS